MIHVRREKYLKVLSDFREKDLIKVVSGVRRAGKSTLFDLFIGDLLEDNISESHIIKINFEDINYEFLKDYKKLHDYILDKCVDDQQYYIFLDEIQNVDKFELAVDSLYLRKNLDLYITGSNAYFLSGELATYLTGRYVELEILPLSFKEYDELININHLSGKFDTKMDIYEHYIKGSFPYLANFIDNEEARNYFLSGIYNTVVLEDVISRNGTKDVTKLNLIHRFLLDNIGNLISPNKIANTLTSNNNKVDLRTVDKYLNDLVESYLYYEVRRYDIKGKEYLARLSKYYTVDVGFRNIVLENSSSDYGHILENIIFLELKRRFKKIAIGSTKNHEEVDFVAMDGDDIEYYQVAYTVMDENVLMRELSPLMNINDSHPKYLISMDVLGKNRNFNGIKQVNAIEWLLEGWKR